MRSFFLLFLLLVGMLPARIAPAQAGQADPRRHTLTGLVRIHREFPSRFLSTTHTVLVYLPPGYDDTANQNRHYPVLYLQDGQNVFDGATAFIPGKEWRVDETAERLIGEKQVEPLIIVAIYNAGFERANEYLPTHDAKFWGGVGGNADAYGKMLTDELKPFIDKTYRTRPDADSTGIGGSSLGGVLTLYLGLTRPDVFRRLAILSPSVWWDNRYPVREVNALKERPPLRIWLDIGTKEGNDPAKIVADTRALRDALMGKGWVLGKDLAYTEAEGASHNEDAWAARVGPILRFLFPVPPAE
jgi:predicted alpha/beta superfamily hydrolase